MTRGSVVVEERTPVRYQQLEMLIRPKLIGCMPDNLKKALTARGTQSIEDECQDILYLLTKACRPGAAGDKQSILNLFTNPNFRSRPEAAQAEMQRWWQAGRRCRELSIAAPDVTLLYAGFRSIFHNLLCGANQNLQMRLINLENDLGLSHVVTLEKLFRVADFAEGKSISYHPRLKRCKPRIASDR